MWVEGVVTGGLFCFWTYFVDKVFIKWWHFGSFSKSLSDKRNVRKFKAASPALLQQLVPFVLEISWEVAAFSVKFHFLRVSEKREGFLASTVGFVVRSIHLPFLCSHPSPAVFGHRR